jgi:hypothetical protein
MTGFKHGHKVRDLLKSSNLVFHSDGGGQYYSKFFLEKTRKYEIRSSMGKTAFENPHAERINGTIKNDYFKPYQPTNFEELTTMLKKAVKMYNQQRPHQSLCMYTPQEFKRLVEKGLLKKGKSNQKRKSQHIIIINKKRSTLFRHGHWSSQPATMFTVHCSQSLSALRSPLLAFHLVNHLRHALVSVITPLCILFCRSK